MNDIEFEKKFDYITLIGVLEYQGTYTETTNPYKDFLVKIKQLLKPDGKLLVAIENQYGLKYWCGTPEDHVEIPFEGINQYKDVERGVRTFSKKALDILLRESGFLNTYFYYPFPDYKLPTVIYSQDVLPSKKDTVNSENFRGYSSAGENTLIANEKNLKVRMLVGYISYSRKKSYEIRDAGPTEFLSLIKNADYILTNSFHGTAFSLIYKKDFNVVLPSTRTSRVIDLLNEIGLMNRIVAANECELNFEHIDYETIEDSIRKIEVSSKSFLREALGGDTD